MDCFFLVGGVNIFGESIITVKAEGAKVQWIEQNFGMGLTCDLRRRFVFNETHNELQSKIFVFQRLNYGRKHHWFLQ